MGCKQRWSQPGCASVSLPCDTVARHVFRVKGQSTNESGTAIRRLLGRFAVFFIELRYKSMKHYRIHVEFRMPGLRRLGEDTIGTVVQAVDAFRGIKHIGDGVKLHTRVMKPDPEPEEEENVLRDEPLSEDAFEETGEYSSPADAFFSEAEEKAKRLWDSVLRTAEEIKEDIDIICERDPAARSRAEVLMLYSGLHALLIYRAAHALHEKGFCFTARAMSQIGRLLTGIEIHPGAQIGRGLFIDHGSGVVIGETAIIGDYCTLYQGVTLGGTGKDTGKRHPTLGDHVMVGAGAKLLGNFTVGSGSKIAAGAVVLGEVPENSTAVGIPARVVRRAGQKVDDLDQTHIPDPVSQALCRIGVRLEEMQAKIDALEKAGTEADAQ